MGKAKHLKGTLSGSGNKLFRIETRIIHLIRKKYNFKNTPIIINNYNRLEYLKAQVNWLLECGHYNLHIIDNASTYPPLLDYYKRVKATVYRLDRNVGHEALWRTHIYQRFSKYYYVLTDPDVLPDETTPTDYIEYFYSLLQEYKMIKKVGFGLRINDLPDYYPNKSEVITWEKQFEENPVRPGVYKARIDTTFALYRPGAFFQCWEETLRTGAPYLLRHMPWYENPSTLSPEGEYYLQHAGASSSWYKTLSGEDERYKLK
jgi:hypothetical protein